MRRSLDQPSSGTKFILISKWFTWIYSASNHIIFLETEFSPRDIQIVHRSQKLGCESFVKSKWHFLFFLAPDPMGNRFSLDFIGPRPPVPLTLAHKDGTSINGARNGFLLMELVFISGLFTVYGVCKILTTEAPMRLRCGIVFLEVYQMPFFKCQFL